MKYIRSYNESNQNKLLIFCNSHLVELLDNIYKVEFFNRVIQDIKVIEILITPINDNVKKVWPDIKLDFLPFLEMLSYKYTILPSIGISAKTGEVRENIVEISGQNITRDEVFDNNLILQCRDIRYIKINIKIEN